MILDNLLTPPILFFALGIFATLVRSDLEIPQAVTRGLSVYLLFSIGMRGGAELAAAGISPGTVAPLLAGTAAGALLPLGVFAVLRRRLGAADAAAVAATYGSISAVTFITACSFLEDRGEPWSGHMVAAMALMESPAILVGVFLARRAGVGSGGAGLGSVLHESCFNGPVLLLLGSLVVGFVGGEKGWKSVEPFAYGPFKGVLCLFLLDMGLIAAKRMGALRSSGAVLLGFGVLAPLLHAALGVAVAHVLGLSKGDALLFVVLLASASYIAVPAALRIALPEANPSVYLPTALAVTFPLNIAVGLPVYMTVIDRVWAAG